MPANLPIVTSIGATHARVVVVSDSQLLVRSIGGGMVVDLPVIVRADGVLAVDTSAAPDERPVRANVRLDQQ